MATYTDISKEEMGQFLEAQGFQLISLEGVWELVWAKIFRTSRSEHGVYGDGSIAVSMRVYSGINPSGRSRGVGEDAIRVALFWKDEGEIRKVGGSKRVHRVKGWRKNLQSRIDGWADDLGPACYNCLSPMVLRTPKKGGKKFEPFYGCASWPRTKYKGSREAGKSRLMNSANGHSQG